MGYVLKAVLSSAQHPEYGQITVPFPIPDEKYDRMIELLEPLEIGDALRRDCRVDELDSFYTVLNRLVGSLVNFDELDYLAKRLDSFDDGEAAQFQGMACKLGVSNIKDFINLTFCCQQATVITDFSDLDAIGRQHYMTMQGGGCRIEELERLDGRKFALDLILNHLEGRITPYGVVYDNGMKLEQLYDGRHFPCYHYQPNLLAVGLSSRQEPENTDQITWLLLPCSEQQLQRGIARSGVNIHDARIWYEDSLLPSEVEEVLEGQREDLFALNDMATAIAALSDLEQKKLTAVMEMAKPECAGEIRELAKNLELFEFAPKVRTPAEYGRYMIQDSGHYEYDPNLEEFYDYERYGKLRMEKETGAFTEKGYVAYDVMMENHGHELRGAACVIHSDQGSQYLSTTFQRLLSDDGFLQSVSDRGNSQDNAPMESFFGRLKCELLDLVALCPDASTVSRMISGYIDAYNHRHYQYALAGLTPSEYYTYVTTGIYPVDNYYGIKATELMPIQALIAARRRAAEEKAKKYREASAKKRAMAQGKKKDPEFVIARDQRILRREIAKWTRSKELALQQISHLREILELSQKARAYLMTASADLILQLYNGENWGAHPELAYIYKMRELF